LIVFEQLVKDEEESFEANPQPAGPKAESKPYLPQLFHSWLIRTRTPIFKALTLVNHEIRAEFLQIFRQKAMFRFTLDASHPESANLWKIPLSILSSMRTVRLKILANPGLVGEFDPRRATGDWILRDRVFELMQKMTHLEDLRLSIQACGNQLWNPIWLWHYTSQAFKVSDIQAFKRMSFDLEGWNMREPNHLERNDRGVWEWKCAENHFVLPDTDGPQPIRSFCAAIYAECKVCEAVEEDTN